MTSRKKSLSSSISKVRHRSLRSLFVTGVLFGTMFALSAGCTKKESATSATPKPPTRAYVRLEALTAQHPLQEQVRQLREAEERLRRLAATPKTPNTVSALSLPALPETPVRRDLAAEAATRRKEQRERVQRVAERELQAFADISANRLERLNEQRREELLAELSAGFYDRIRREREAILDRIRERLSVLAEQKLVIRARLSILRAQLETNAVFPLPVPDTSALAAEITQLDANPDAPYITQRARIEWRRRNEAAKIVDINTKITAAETQGRREIAAITSRIQNELEAEVRRRLALEREDKDFGPALRAQQRILIAALQEEARIATAALREAAKIAQGDGLRPADIERLFGKSNAVATNPGRAADRIAAQRKALEKHIEINVADAVRDAARNRNVNVELVRGTAAPAGRADLTGDFGRWIQPGETLPGGVEG
jgi:hypothetical protein